MTSVTRKDGSDQLAAFIFHNGPMQVGINAGIFKYKDKNSFVSASACAMANISGIDHSLGVVGFGSDLIRGDYWILKNSWGSNWGDGGFVYIARGNNLWCGDFFAAGAHVYTFGDPAYYFEAPNNY